MFQDADNTATGEGGAIEVAPGASVAVSASTFSGDTATNGGAIANNAGGSLVVSSSTFWGDTASQNGGAIDDGDGSTGDSNGVIVASTFSSNVAPGSGGTVSSGGTGTIWASADVFDGSCAQGAGRWHDAGYNVGADGTCLHGGPGDVDYRGGLASLFSAPDDNGGPTETMLLLGGNPATGAVPHGKTVSLDGQEVPLCPATDQRGVASGPGHDCDAGSVQDGAESFAYASGLAPATARSCPLTADVTRRCTLGEAMAVAAAGGTIALATPGAVAAYIGNWDLPGGVTGPLWIQPAPGVADPTLDGNDGRRIRCSTGSCNGAVLTVPKGLDVHVDDIMIKDARNTSDGFGGAIANDRGSTLYVTGSTFLHDFARRDGGAIDNADAETAALDNVLAGWAGLGTLSVSTSTFSGDRAGSDGGAIDNADGSAYAGGSYDVATGAVTVSSSMFSGNSALASNGGAIDSGGSGGDGALSVSGTTFSENMAPMGAGGAISNGVGYLGSGQVAVVGSVFSSNSAWRGGAIDNSDGGRPSDDACGGAWDNSLVVHASTFSENAASTDGGAVDNADYDVGELLVSGSTFSGNNARADGGAIDNGDNGYYYSGYSEGAQAYYSCYGGEGTSMVFASTFFRDVAGKDGGAIDNGDHRSDGSDLTVWASTFSGGSAGYGPALDSGGHGGAATILAAADLFDNGCARSTGRSDEWRDAGYNVGRDRTCFEAGERDNDYGRRLALVLGALADNGGPTTTMLPLDGNPAIAAIPVGTVLNGSTVLRLCPATDQRGVESAPGRVCDIGAVQSTV
jgi:hypothetical protein